MSKSKKGPNLSSVLSEKVTLRKIGGQVVVTNRPKPRPAPTENQLAAQAKFLEATQYAKRQVAQEESNALYATGITDKKHSVYMVAVSDYLVAPKVEHIDTLDYHGAVGDTIVVKATDDFKVTKVRVLIMDSAGALLEEGEAGYDEQQINLWEYKAKSAITTIPGTVIRAVAYDRPGNKGMLEVKL